MFAAVSCSMDDENVMDDMGKEITNASEQYSLINFGIDLNNPQTKSGTAVGNDTQGLSDDEKKINSCRIVILENNKILDILTGTTTQAGDVYKVGNIKFLTKYWEGRKLTAMAIINAEGVDLSGCVDRDDLDKPVQDLLEADKLVKIGEKVITFGPQGNVSQHYPSAIEAANDANVQTINIPVHHLAARLEFANFKYTVDENSLIKNPSVKLLSARFVNVNKKSLLLSEEARDKSGIDGKVTSTSCMTSLENGVAIQPGLRSYSYANTNSDKAVALEVVFSVDGRNYTKQYVVNRPTGSYADGDFTNSVGKGNEYVRAGYIYRLTVNITVSKDWVKSSINCYTNDWIHNEWNVEF